MPFVVALAMAAVLSPVAGRVGTAVGLVDRPGEELKIHDRPVPVLGGAAVVASVLGTLAILGRPPPLAMTLAVMAALLAGTVDDLRPLPTWVRAVVQAGAGAVLVAGGMALGDPAVIGIVGLVAVSMACTNAVNLVDGQDGLVAGVAALAALGLAVVNSLAGGSDGLMAGLALAGALIGFLLWNRPPARVFLGNGGAYGVGILLAVLAARTVSVLGWKGLLAAGLCLGVFAFELAYTVARRAVRRRPLMRGDRLHSYDVMARALGSRNRATLLYWGFAAATAGLGILAARLPPAWTVGIAVLGAVAAVGVGMAMWSRTVPSGSDRP